MPEEHIVHLATFTAIKVLQKCLFNECEMQRRSSRNRGQASFELIVAMQMADLMISIVVVVVVNVVVIIIIAVFVIVVVVVVVVIGVVVSLSCHQLRANYSKSKNSGSSKF